jgi:site-specific recombinase XerD
MVPSLAFASPQTPHSGGTSPVPSYEIGPALDDRFEQFVRYKHGYKKVSAATVKWYRETFRIFLKFLVTKGVTKIDSSITSHIIDWIATLSTRPAHPLSPFTLRSYTQALHSFFGHLETFDGFPDPFRLLEQPKVPSDPFPKALTHEQCVRILDAAQNTAWADEFERCRAAAMLGVALYTGLRRGEVLRLKFTDVNLAEEWIQVENGKGNRSRITFIAPELASLLRSYLDARRRAHLESVEFFTSRHGGSGVKVKTFTRIVDRVRATSGVRFSIHMLRHSFVTTLARDRTPPHDIRALAGHRDLKTTQRYTRMFEEDLRHAMSRVSFRGVPTAQHRGEASAPPSQTPPQTHASTASAS